MLRIPIPRRLRHWLATARGPRRLRAKLRISARDAAGERDAIVRTLDLRLPRRR